MKYWKATFIGLGLIPYGFIISLLTFYFYAEHICGHHVWYNNPDPKDFSVYEIYNSIIDYACGIWVVSLPISVILLITFLIKNWYNISWKNISWKSILFFMLGQSLVFFLLSSDIMEWYAD